MAYTLTYTLNSDGNSYTLSGYSGDKPAGELVIPDSYASKPVTSIGRSAFSGCSGLTSVIIPDSVTSVGSSSFSGCSSLESITIPFVGAQAGKTSSDTFQYPFGYIFGTDSYTGGTATKQTYYAASTSSTTYDIYYIPSSLKSVTVTGGNILRGAFSYCRGLTSIIIGNGVTSIGSYAFEECSGLASVIIPNSVTSIGIYAFSGCSGLTSVTIGNGLTRISDYMFTGCSGLTSITIPNSVTYIGSYAFRNCSGLTSVTIPDSATSIGYSAFRNCTGLTSVTIGNSMTSIGDNTFENCSSLTSITIPESVTSIGSSVFRNCSSLTNITVDVNNPSYQSIDGNLYTKSGTMFIQYAIGKTATSFEIPDVVRNVSPYAFSGCSSLTGITIPNSVTSIGPYAFENCTGLAGITIPNGIKTINNYTFKGCTGLTSIVIGNSVTSIGYNAFEGCTALTGVTIPESVTTINSAAFRYCSSLTSVTIGNGVTNISSSAFRDCGSLAKINMLPTTPPTIQNNILDATIQNIYVQSQSAETYKTATNWNTYADKITEFPILDLSSLLMYNDKVKAKIDTVKCKDGVGVPTGGTAGQVLRKKSGTNYDTEWGDAGSGGVGQKGTGAGAEIFNEYEGEYANVASGKNSHAEGYATKASGENQHVQGKFNIEDTENKYAHIVGNGESEIARSNAHTLDWGGNAWYAGKVSGGTEANPALVEKPNDYVTKKHFDDNKIEVVDNLTTNDATKALSAKQGVWLNDVNEALTAPVKVGDNLTALYFDTEKTPDLSIFTYTLDSDFGFYTAGLIGFTSNGEVVGYLSAVKVSDTVYALIYENRATGDISYLYVSDNIEYGGTSFSKGWQNFNNPFPVTSATVVDVDQTATKPWNGVWVSKKAFYARIDEIPAEPNNGTLTIQKNGTTVGTFGANQSENTTANITVPTKVSQLQNDAGYTKNKGTVISVRVNGTTYTADANGLVDLGTISGGTTYRAVYNEIY